MSLLLFIFCEWLLYEINRFFYKINQIELLAFWVKISADGILIYFPQQIGYDIACKFCHKETIRVTSQTLFLPENIISLSCAEFVERVLKVN